MKRKGKYEKQMYDVILKAFSNSEILNFKKYKYYHSKICHITLLDLDNNERRELLIKKYTSKSSSEILNEYKNQELFYSFNKNLIYTTPQPILFDVETETILMEYVQGNLLKSVLLKKIDLLDISEYMDQCADLLYSYHCAFRAQENSIFNIDCPILGRIPSTEIFLLYKRHENFNLKNLVRPFLDFSPWNMIFSEEKIYLIDFPEKNCVCTPHIDIARFSFCLNIIKHTPNLFKLRMGTNWDQHNAFNRFIKRYSERQGIILNNSDMMLIEFFYKKNEASLMLQLKSSPSVVEKMMYFYLKRFL